MSVTMIAQRGRECLEINQFSFLCKDNERDIRAQGLDRHAAYEIFGPVQKRSTNVLGALCNNIFQEALIKVLVASREDDAKLKMKK